MRLLMQVGIGALLSVGAPAAAPVRNLRRPPLNLVMSYYPYTTLGSQVTISGNTIQSASAIT